MLNVMMSKMKTIVLLLSILVLTVGYMGLMVWTVSARATRDVQVGDVYLRSFESGGASNPFAGIEVDTIEILDIRAGYVLYRVSDAQSTYTASDELDYMNRTKTLIKKIR